MGKDEFQHLDERIHRIEERLERRLQSHDERLEEIAQEVREQIDALTKQLSESLGLPETCKNCEVCQRAGVTITDCELLKRYHHDR